MIARRSFLTGLASMLAAPAIVHAGNLMPVKVMVPTLLTTHGLALGDTVRLVLPELFLDLQRDINAFESGRLFHIVAVTRR